MRADGQMDSRFGSVGGVGMRCEVRREHESGGSTGEPEARAKLAG